MRTRAKRSSKSRFNAITRAIAETLEPRTLLSLSAVGGEFHVNTYTANFQGNPAVAADGDGDSVIVWQSVGQEGTNNTGIFAQRFNAAGVPQGTEIPLSLHAALHEQ